MSARKKTTWSVRLWPSSKARFALSLFFGFLAVILILSVHSKSPVTSPTSDPDVGIVDAASPRLGRLLFFRRPSGPPKNKVKFHLYSQPEPTWIVRADDCLAAISVNGAAVDLSSYPAVASCDYRKRIVLTALPGFVQGDNLVEIELKNASGAVSLELAVPAPVLQGLLFACFTLSLWLLLSCLPVFQTLNRVQVAILIAATFYFLCYFESTLHFLRGNDAEAHLERVRLVERGLLIPKSKDCWQCYHPGLYYWLGALADKVTAFTPISLEDKLQLLSLVGFTLYLLFSVALINAFVQDSSLRIAFALFLVAIPSARFHSIRLGNDLLAYPVTAAFLYGLERWRRDAKASSWWQALSASWLGLYTKASAWGLILILCGVTLYQGKGKQPRNRAARRLRAALLIATTLGVGSVLALQWYQDPNPRRHVVAALRVSNKLTNYLPTQWNSFLSRPFPNPWMPGREQFWEYWLKTAVWGETQYSGRLLTRLAGMLNFQFAVLAIVSLLSAFLCPPKQRAARSVLYGFFFLQIAMAVLFRVKFPCATAADFRYSYLLLPVGLSLLGLAIENSKKSGKVGRALCCEGWVWGVCLTSLVVGWISMESL